MAKRMPENTCPRLADRFFPDTPKRTEETKMMGIQRQKIDGKAFTFWLFAMIISLHCIFIYLINAIVCIVMSRKMFNILKLTLILCAFPLCVFVGCAAGVVNSIIWNIYFAIIFVIQIISLFVKNETNQ